MVRPKHLTPTPAELKVLNILWEHGPSTVREVMECLAKQRGYTTVLSLMQVMHEKKLLKRKPEGRAFRYSPRSGNLALQPVLGSKEQIRLSASLTEPDSDELISSAVLVGSQALLARTSRLDDKRADAEFFMITSELPANPPQHEWIPK